jgi:hypothetical protein
MWSSVLQVLAESCEDAAGGAFGDLVVSGHGEGQSSALPDFVFSLADPFGGRTMALGDLVDLSDALLLDGSSLGSLDNYVKGH